MPDHIAVVHGEGAEDYCDENSGFIGVVLHNRNLGNSKIGPEYLLRFPNGLKSWVPQRLCEAMRMDDSEDFLVEHGLEISEDGEMLVFMSDPEEEEAEDPTTETQVSTGDDGFGEPDPTPADTSNGSDAAGSDENVSHSAENYGERTSDGEEGSEQS